MVRLVCPSELDFSSDLHIDFDFCFDSFTDARARSVRIIALVWRAECSLIVTLYHYSVDSSPFAWSSFSLAISLVWRAVCSYMWSNAFSSSFALPLRFAFVFAFLAFFGFWFVERIDLRAILLIPCSWGSPRNGHCLIHSCLRREEIGVGRNKNLCDSSKARVMAEY